jgi:hypothetical protein
MAKSSTRSRCPAESDHQRAAAQIGADPSSAFDGDGEPRLDAARFARPSGVETVRAELMVDRHNAHRLRLYAGARANRDLANAERFYTAHSVTLAAHFKSTDPTPWLNLSAPTVRAWVAVAREAARS